MATERNVREVMAELYPDPNFEETVKGNCMDSLTVEDFAVSLEAYFDVEIPMEWFYRDTLGQLAQKIAAMSEK